MAALLEEYKIEHYRSSLYRPQANDAVEVTNKNVKRILSKMLENYRDWSEYLQFVLWGYRTTARTSTSVTPYSLVYGYEAVLPIEIEIRSLRVLLESKIPEYQWVESRLAQLTLLNEKRIRAMYHSQLYQKRIARAYNKKIKPGKIKEEDLVLKLIRPIMADLRGKFKPNWEGLYLVKKLFSKGAAILLHLEGNKFREPINLDKL